ncbi:hypothetical protein [Candidatus Deianiraea vastatrix]|uniref:DNA polymerase III subunit delta n=1 Tax=Candidatus Deianiraea vastatrix TaxID=2163644 RepID=A0A5B8XDZ9_9RICK|nr:hypothetical protein [Candidatus Deianiraea vastatrix]QED23569.1 DNA polymerase III subunit delta' [Candidatus Deianiraea vastatrix]
MDSLFGEIADNVKNAVSMPAFPDENLKSDFNIATLGQKLPSQHHEIYTKIINLFNNNALHHATILYGVYGIGKYILAKEIASYIILSTDTTHNSYNLLQNNTHPDLFTINEDKISVDNARQILTFTSLKSSFSKSKIIILNIDGLNMQAANAILKALEEPQPNTFFFMITSNLSAVMKTIRSRSTLQFVPNIDYNNFFSHSAIQYISLQDAKILKDLSNANGNISVEMMNKNILQLMALLTEFIFAGDLKSTQIENMLGKQNAISFDIVVKLILYILKVINPIYNARFELPSVIANSENIQKEIKRYRDKTHPKNYYNYFKMYDEIIEIIVNKNTFNLDTTHCIHAILILIRNAIKS